MTWPIVVELAGPPKRKGRHRSRIVSRSTGAPFLQSYADPETARYETQLRYVAGLAMGYELPSQEALRVEVTAVLPIARSWTKKRQNAARAGIIRPTGHSTGDADNYLKILDALNGIVWHDDSQVVEASVSKVFGDAPRLRITIEPIDIELHLVSPRALPMEV
jgi:Holliday junction resolvase RusA-like endonuclease